MSKRSNWKVSLLWRLYGAAEFFKSSRGALAIVLLGIAGTIALNLALRDRGLSRDQVRGVYYVAALAFAAVFLIGGWLWEK